MRVRGKSILQPENCAGLNEPIIEMAALCRIKYQPLFFVLPQQEISPIYGRRIQGELFPHIL